MNVLVFDIWSDYAHFRKPYTTTSPLTYPFPPRTVIAGIISAIIGIPKNDVICQDETSLIAVSLSKNNPVKKIRVGENLTQVPKKPAIVDLKKTQNKLNQIRYEFLKDPRYTIYFYHPKSEIYGKLKNHLQNHTSVYTPYLGISEHIANFEFQGEFELIEREGNGRVSLDCVITKKNIKKDSVDFSNNAEYFNVRMPNRMNNERIVQEYAEIIFERNGHPINAIPLKYWQIKEKNDKGRNIVFL
jgi:CRISPR-associated protein Cas5h